MAKSKGREENGYDIYNFSSVQALCLVIYMHMPWYYGPILCVAMKSRGWVRTINCPNHKLLLTPLFWVRSPNQKNLLIMTWTKFSSCLFFSSRFPFPASPQNYSHKPITFSYRKLWDGRGEVSHPLSTTNPTSHGPWLSICSLVQPLCSLGLWGVCVVLPASRP